MVLEDQLLKMVPKNHDLIESPHSLDEVNS